MKTLKIIKNNYAPSNVRTICPICDSIFEFDPAIECNERTVICPCCNKSFAIGEKYIEIRRRSLKIMGKKRAKEHYDFIKEQYYKEIDNSIANTTIHACESIEARIPQYSKYYIRRSWVI